jgi:hypothetical protein
MSPPIPKKRRESRSFSSRCHVLSSGEFHDGDPEPGGHEINRSGQSAPAIEGMRRTVSGSDGVVAGQQKSLKFCRNFDRFGTTSPEAKLFIRADKETLHSNVTRMLDEIRASGFTKISFEIKSQALSGFSER